MAKSKQFRVKGLKNVVSNLNQEIKKIKGDVRKGLQAAGVFIKSESQEITPHDKGVLANSAFYSTALSGDRFVLRVGYTASYAAAVHEMPNSTNWSKPDTGNKFLFNAVMNNQREILQIVKNRAKI